MTGHGDAPLGCHCDSNAGAVCLPDVLQEFVAVERRCPGNPASAHTEGRAARGVVEAARRRIATALGVETADVLFTSGGTEACNLAVLGLGDPTLPVLLAPVEHPCVFEPARLRGQRLWQVDAEGRALVAAPDGPVGLVCLVHGQSEVGTLQPVATAQPLADDLEVPLFVDAAQTLGRLPLDALLAAGAFVALSPHKAGGLRGHGVLLGHDLGVRLRPLLRGGGQELGLRPGTQSPALAAANAIAIERAAREQAERAARMAALRAAFLSGFASTQAQARVLTPLADSLPNTVMLCLEAVEGRNLLPAFDLAGVHASHGSACSSGAPTPPRVLLAMGIEGEEARRCVRFSFDWRDDVNACRLAGERVGEIARRLRKKN